MACKPCEEKKKAAAAAVEQSKPVVHPSRLAIHCYCGLTRLIPAGLKPDDIFELVPCPKCGTGFRGKFVGEGVEELS